MERKRALMEEGSADGKEDGADEIRKLFERKER